MDQPKRDAKESDGNLGLEAAKGGIASAQVFARETVQELKKVQWPSRRQVTVETVVVILTVAIVTTLVTVFDWVLTAATNLLFAQ